MEENKSQLNSNRPQNPATRKPNDKKEDKGVNSAAAAAMVGGGMALGGAAFAAGRLSTMDFNSDADAEEQNDTPAHTAFYGPAQTAHDDAETEVADAQMDENISDPNDIILDLDQMAVEVQPGDDSDLAVLEPITMDTDVQVDILTDDMDFGSAAAEYADMDQLDQMDQLDIITGMDDDDILADMDMDTDLDPLGDLLS